MADRLRVTELDFDQIKSNLKTFLRQQKEFNDYDFEGSGLSVLIDLLAYNTHYNAYYMNMLANESFLDTALLRDNVISHAKTLGYTPYSFATPVAIVNVTVETFNSDAGQLTIPKGFTFFSNIVENTSFNFVTLDAVTVSKVGTQFIFENVPIYEGQLLSFNFTYDESTNPKSIFTLPNNNIDTETLFVSVRPNPSSSLSSVYQKVDDVLNVDGDSEVFFLQETADGYYQMYFGDNVIGKALPDGAIISAQYLITNGDAANKASGFVGSSSIGGFTEYTVTTVREAAGGKLRESVDNIKQSAISQFSAQNRLVTVKDYESYILSRYPNIDAISVWGGEEETPKVYGKVFISMKPKENFFLSESEKARIVEDIVKPKSIVTVDAIVRDPDYLYLLVNSNVSYNSTKTTKTPEELRTSIRNAILTFKDTNLNKFASTLLVSKLQDAIDSSDQAILGNETVVRLQKRIVPKLNESANYTIRFNAPLHRGTVTNRMTSSEFQSFDNLGVLRTVQVEEIPNSFTGIQSIEISNPGYGYTNPIVTITGDGTGAEAIATVVNGKISSIELINRGQDYSRAVVTITDATGVSATANPIVNAQVGTLRLVYFDQNATRQTINANIGQIDYVNGTITLSGINIQDVTPSDGLIRFTIEADRAIIESVRNSIITIDETDPSSITVTYS
jgi:hypothetical protein